MAFRFRLIGTPITNETLAAMPEYQGKAIGERDRAQEALNSIAKDGKKLQAKEFVHQLKRESGNGASTLCIIYNATGDTVSFVGYHDWFGYVEKAPYPTEIGNGQWGAFLHVKNTGRNRGSSGAVVYRGRNDKGTIRDFMLAWYTPLISNCAAYTEVRESKHFDNAGVWNGIYNNMWHRQSGSSYDGCFSTVQIDNTSSPMFEGIMTLDGLKFPASGSK